MIHPPENLAAYQPQLNTVQTVIMSEIISRHAEDNNLHTPRMSLRSGFLLCVLELLFGVTAGLLEVLHRESSTV